VGQHFQLLRQDLQIRRHLEAGKHGISRQRVVQSCLQVMAAPNWNSRPQDYCDQAKRRAIAALHSKHAHGLTALEKAYLKSLREGRINPDEP